MIQTQISLTKIEDIVKFAKEELWFSNLDEDTINFRQALIDEGFVYVSSDGDLYDIDYIHVTDDSIRIQFDGALDFEQIQIKLKSEPMSTKLLNHIEKLKL